MNNGLIYIFTGDGKGKTSAALGVAMRSLLLKKKVTWIAFYKQESWGLSESKLIDKFANLEMVFGGKGFHMQNRIEKVGDRGNVVVDTASKEEHLLAVKACLQKAKQQLELCPFLLIMDEILNAVMEGLITEKDVMEALEHRGDTHIVLTGRVDKRLKRLWQVADLITKCAKIKHPYDAGKLAVAGLDY